MKKLILSSLTIILFGLYGYFERSSHNLRIVDAVSTGSGLIPIPANSVTITPIPTNLQNKPSLVTPTPIIKNGNYSDGTYIGNVVNAYYGNVQVKVMIQNGLISDIVFISYPNSHGHSIMINNYAMPILKQEAISAQNANVNIVSGATLTSEAFQQSLANALNQSL